MTNNRLQQSHGSALTVAAVSAGVLSIMVAGLLSYMGNEYLLNYRSHRWTQSLHLAEGAVEVGFAELNYQHFQGEAGFTSGRGWAGSTNLFWKYGGTFTDTAGSTVGQTWTYVFNVGTYFPKIWGYANVPSTPGGPSIWRLVQVTVATSTRYPVGLMSRERLDLNGNNIYTDSFDSTDPNKSDSGLYDFAERQPNGDIASNDVLINSVNIGNADVYGQVYTGVGGTVAMGANGSVGPTLIDADRATTVPAGEDAGWIRHDFSVDVPSVVLPAGADSWSSLGTINDDRDSFSAGDWRANSINLNANKTVTIGPGTVRLYVSGNVNIAGNAFIQILPNTTLQVYVAGNVQIAGKGMVNDTGLSENNQWLGLPSSSSWNVNGNGQWIGTLYAPQADLTLNGGGVDGDMSGSVVTRRITLTGNSQFHYDEALRGEDFASGYRVVSWQSYKWTGSEWVLEQ